MQTIVGLPLFVFKTIKSLPIINLRKKRWDQIHKDDKTFQCAFCDLIVVCDKIFYKFQTSENRENDGHAKKTAKKYHCLPIIKKHTRTQNNNKKPSLNFFIWAMSQGLQNNKN